MSVRATSLFHLPHLPRVLPWLTHALAIRRQRAHLAQLDDHLLRDIGLSRADAQREAVRPVWDAPCSWHDAS